jgi:hypothetical protein
MIDVSRELIAFLRDEYDRCRDDTLDDDRAVAIDFYNGEPFGDEEDGRSQLVTRDVAEVTDYMVISILRTLVSGDRVVEFAHQDMEKAQEATETITHIFMEEQNGYIMLHDWLKAGLLEKNAVAMTYPEEMPAKRRVEQGVSAMALAVASEQGIEIVEAEQVGEDDGGPVFNVTVMQPQPPKFCNVAVPNEEFYCSPDARSIDEAPLKGRKVRKSVSDLIKMGFDQDDLDAIGHEHDADSLTDSARDESRWTDMDRTGANRVLWLHEEYALFDENGDGITELLYIKRIGDTVLAIEELEDASDHPFEDWCPFPMPHRRVGQSLADKTMDIQRTRSVLMRQAMDNLYQTNSPRVTVHEDSMGENTIDDLLTVRPGALIRWKGMNRPEPFAVPFTAGNAFEAMEIMAGERESRTGITRMNQGLDADALNKTATGTALMQAQGQQVEEYLARNFANALARLFTKLARNLKRYGAPIPIMIDGEFKEVDPSQWPDDMIAKPRVGLGSGRKEQRLQYRQMILALQKECLAGGLGIVGEEQIFNSAKGAIADMNLGNATDYFIDPATLQQVDEQGNPVPKPEKPDPEMMKAEAEMQMKQAELEAKQQDAQIQMQLKQQEGAAKIELAREEAAAKLQLEREKAALEADLAREKMQFEMQTAQQKMAFEQAMANRRAEMEEALAQRNASRAEYEAEENLKLKRNRPGGALDK